ncbi:MAG: tRNA glutamyl-Q(34) synthetase GluQRS [Ectothiorhodospiraceae bacterium]|nr:tRNA glutamyl-Q(34) synthetase GluQRS [Ectothiorhodospiraceae bacterium]
MTIRGRFAPSPTGALHFGSLVAAVASFLQARSRGGEWLVRIEDVDRPREVAGAADAILRELARLGLEWDGPVLRQSARTARYEAALAELARDGWTFPCACTRREAGDVYPGTCRRGIAAGRTARAVRLRVTGRVDLVDQIQGPYGQDLEREVGDFVVRRADGLHAYHLAVVVDDLDQGVTEVVRGADLLDSTPRQILLWRALRAEPPRHAHLPVAVDAAGRKLGKQTGAPPTSALAAPVVLGQVLAFLGHPLPATLAGAPADQILAWAVASWDLARVPATAPGTVYTAPEDDDLDSR